MGEFKIELLPRVHITLIAMGETDYRINGGVGFGIDGPRLSIIATAASTTSIRDARNWPLEPKELCYLESWVASIANSLEYSVNLAVTLSGMVPSHAGFGAGTQLRLGLLELLGRANRVAFTKEQLLHLSGRGRTSGIGVERYFNGGYFLSAGQPRPNASSKPQHLSSDSQPQLAPTASLLHRGEVPEWELVLLIPPIPRTTLSAEKEFFRRTCPISNLSVYESLYHSVFGVCAALNDCCFESFCTAINTIQTLDWKRAEWALYGAELNGIRDRLFAKGAKAVGLSSLGPSLYCFSRDTERLVKHAKQVAPGAVILKSRLSNRPSGFL